VIDAVQEKIPAAAVEMMSRYREAWNRGDAAAVAELHTEQALYCSATTGLLVGKAAMQRAFQKGMNAGLCTLQMEALEGELFGERLHTVIRFQFLCADGSPIWSGHTLIIATLEAGAWQITHHWTVDQSPWAR
jgi:ketosteroid isomerase-like protein